MCVESYQPYEIELPPKDNLPRYYFQMPGTMLLVFRKRIVFTETGLKTDWGKTQKYQRLTKLVSIWQRRR